jgi:hypothetical protein
MKKTHCDVCDAVGGADVASKEVRNPSDDAAYSERRLRVSVYVDKPVTSRGRFAEPGCDAARLEVCDDCRLMLVAAGFGLHTAHDVAAERENTREAERKFARLEERVRSATEELPKLRLALLTIALGGIDIKKAMALAAEAIGGVALLNPADGVEEPAAPDEFPFTL